MTRIETLAYLAGIVDGEGYVGIKRTHRKDAVSAIYHERIQVRMVDEGAIRLLRDTLGGSYYAERTPQAGRRALFCFQTSDAGAAAALDALLPYLRIKKPQARLVLKLRQSKGTAAGRRHGSTSARTMPTRVLADRHRWYETIKKLNRPLV